MDRKLTLSLDGTIIDRAKTYAREQGTSLSKMIENYLNVVAVPTDTDASTPKVETTPLVESLIGVASVPEDFDFRSDYSDYLLEKYK